MNGDIELPGGAHVPAAPGRYHVDPPPDLNEVTDKRFFLEYDFPLLIVRDVASDAGSEMEKLEAHGQESDWKMNQRRSGYHIGLDHAGYQFNLPSSSQEDAYQFQFIPSISYVDQSTWSAVSAQDKGKSYVPCVPTVVIERVTATEKVDSLQSKMSKFINCGTREGVVVDTRGDRVWVYNRGEEPTCEKLDTVLFDNWPEFELDCLAIRDARVRAGLK
ncbi:hypothetical protein F441_15523 [Phytophthora nicotianae CJ01A1]|uniref:Putative restriction endonuclease domain-containing protein n=2 Tax=Phytophthora nicotianae TaxID=4792 RepID=W2G715_PHYNI|nr:hypothetical protein L915_15245 [Phytophthora nicotianae]ETL32261.1 hypothetical protein L916_15136 [Phytophthora nicotianae]ETP08535.1 hypothetical protein F441_15523 [Phytophthora nicotianae CJ01A1]